MIVLGPKLCFTARQDINLWASSSAFNAFARTSSRIRCRVGMKSSWTKRTIIARASPILAVPSKITLVFFTISSSLKSFSLSFSNTAGIISRRLALWVNLWPYFSSRGRRISTFDSGIPPEITHSTISNRNKRISASNVDPLRCSRMSHLLTWLTGFASCLSRCEQLRLYACLTLYACRLSFSLTKRVSLRALQSKFPLTTAKCGFGWSFTRSQAHVVFPFPEDEVELPLPRCLYLPSFSRNWSSCRTPKSCPSCYGNLNRVNICIFLVRPFSF